MNKKRIVITGAGLITPVGIGLEETWQSLLKNKNGIERIVSCDVSDISSKIAGEITNFNVENWLSRKDARRMDRFVQLAIVAADEALKQSKLDISSNPEQIGCIIGSGIGGIATLEDQFATFFDKGPSRVSPFLVPMFISDMASGQVSIRTGARGPNVNTVSACASGADAIGNAYEILLRGDAEAMITGGTDAAVTRMSLSAFGAARALSTNRNHDPSHASRPFDQERDGFVLAEGSGVLILETLESAEKNGAEPIAEIIGYGQSADAFHVTQPSENGEGAARAMKIALSKANIEPHQIGYINAHGTSTPLNDKFETMSIKKVFGENAYSIPISSTKSMIGHTLGAGGGIEAAITALSLRDQKIHGTRNLSIPDPECDLDYVPEQSRNISLDYALSNSLGFGGHNSSLIFKKFTP
ncbi:MAG: beta-ketoacyl-[acyl-carrier-protein] synthase II [Chloroflexi bacterium]|nr:beta-ketoacyl-[acyl-carrier-protein] synthase II [Chloroflexota bacterium]|tara:strand:- start:15419 stop:16663 length:1245 start_codon:yes stop_codon:yes gene_type:complete